MHRGASTNYWRNEMVHVLNEISADTGVWVLDAVPGEHVTLQNAVLCDDKSASISSSFMILAGGQTCCSQSIPKSSNPLAVVWLYFRIVPGSQQVSPGQACRIMPFSAEILHATSKYPPRKNSVFRKRSRTAR